MINEKDIITKMQNGDISSLELLYLEYGKSVYSYALMLSGKKELAEDAVSDTFIQTYDYVIKHKDVGNLKALVYTICRNKIYDSFKAGRRTEVLPDDNSISDGKFPMDERLAVKMAVEKLPSPDKEIVILYCVHGLRHREIAKVLSMPEGTVRWKYRSALKELKRSLEM